MKLGTLKIQCLKLLFANGNEAITEEHLEQYENDDRYRDYLILMTDSINRALFDLECRGCLPVKRHRLENGEGTPPKYDLSGISDFYEIERITAAGYDQYIGFMPFSKEGNVLILLDEIPGEAVDYTLIYRPAAPRVRSTTSDDDELGIPDRFCEAIPYFVKSELFREEEPQEANYARQLWETATQRATQRDVITDIGVERTIPFEQL